MLVYFLGLYWEDFSLAFWVWGHVASHGVIILFDEGDKFHLFGPGA